MQTSTYRMDKQQGLPVEQRESYILYVVMNHSGKEQEKNGYM